MLALAPAFAAAASPQPAKLDPSSLLTQAEGNAALAKLLNAMLPKVK